MVPNPSVISDEEILAFERESLAEERERAAIRAQQLEETLKSDSLAEEMFRKGQAVCRKESRDCSQDGRVRKRRSEHCRRQERFLALSHVRGKVGHQHR